MTTTDPSPQSTGPARPSIRPFTYAEAPDLFETGIMEFGEIPEAYTANVRDDSLGIGMETRVLFADNPPGSVDDVDGVSLIHAWLAPHFQLPPHSHNGDCLYYVVSGSLILGKRVLGPGDGFFVPKNSPYRYTAGPDGLEVVEFRTAVKFDYQYADTNDARWKDRLQYATDHREEWQSAREAFLGSR